MLRRHLKIAEKVVPYSDGAYRVTANLEIVDKDGCVISTTPANPVVLTLFGKETEVSVAWIIAATFKPIYNGESFARDWTVLHIDEDLTNIHPENLLWQPPPGGQDCLDQPGFKIVPGYSRLSVNDSGRVYNRGKQCFSATRSSGNGYINTNTLAPNGEKTAVGVHRLMGLAWLPFTHLVNGLTVNHKDGVKDHNDLENLEWTTYGENNSHAMDLYLRDVRTVVEIRDFYTDEVVVHKSLVAAAEFLGVNSGSLYSHITRKGLQFFKFRYCARYPTDTPWPAITKDELIAKKRLQDQLGVVGYNPNTSTTFITENYAKLALMTGIDKSIIRGYVRRESFGSTETGWHFFRVCDQERFTEYVKRQQGEKGRRNPRRMERRSKRDTLKAYLPLPAEMLVE